MATAKKLPSGSYRVRVYSHTDTDGKKIYESFTAPTKREAEMLAAQWQNKKERRIRSDLTVREAVEGYINAKEDVLSPSTIRAYDGILRNNIDDIADKSVRKMTTEKMQLFVSALSRKLKPGTVRNVYKLVSCALSFYDPDTVYRVTLPPRNTPRTESPSSEAVIALFNAASLRLKKCIALSAFGSLRRGEIAALTYSDIDHNTIHVTKDIVQAKKGVWVLKEFPKTSESVRDAYYHDRIIELLGNGEPDERIVDYASPSSITGCFVSLRDSMKINIRFHDLRHYYASIGAVLGIPDSYLSDFGGWKRGSNVMKSVYQNSIASKSEEYARKMADYFNGIL